MLIALDTQHAGKPGRWADRGAVAADGTTEVDLTRRYVAAADRELCRFGHTCVVLSDGEYRDRWKRADGYGADVYVACHVNAGGGDRGEVYHDARSKRGAALAEAVASVLSRIVPWPCKAAPCGPGSRPYACLSGVRAVALVLEPGYLDCPIEAHRRVLLDDPEGVGVALARGIDAWVRGG